MAAIFFDPEGFSIGGARLMGRNAAGHSFLRGYIRHAAADQFTAFVAHPAHGQGFEAFVRSENSPKPVEILSSTQTANLSKSGTLFLPGPGLDQFARKRTLIDRRGWSLCGITHTTLSARAMDAIAGLVHGHVEPWDALICTSQSVRDTVQTVIESEVDFLRYRFGATRFQTPYLPVIPLGLMADDFLTHDQNRYRARATLGLDPDICVVLFVGRLSFHAKAHPAAMYKALQLAAPGRKIALIECGWFANAAIEEAFAEAATGLAPDVKRIVLDGRVATNRNLAWSAADIFMSLTDNLQETFGITPIEAMASSLPVIVSDWDGYRDTVRHGLDGFRIPTFMPQAGYGENITRRYALDEMDYDHYCGETANLVSVDISAATQALITLTESPELRKRMGDAARRHARASFDWSVIIKAYEDLWRDLAHERKSQGDEITKISNSYPWPARMDALHAFARYPSQLLNDRSLIRKINDGSDRDILLHRSMKIYSLNNKMLPEQKAIKHIFDAIPSSASISIQDLSSQTGLSIAELFVVIMFGLKIGLLAIDGRLTEFKYDTALG